MISRIAPPFEPFPRPRPSHWLKTSLLLWVLAASPLAVAATTVNPALTELDALVSQGRFQDAYTLSQDLLDGWEGEPEFDFLYGMAALESGHSNEAVFAFERLVLNYPDQARLKLELARAFFEQNNLSASRQMFEQVLATNPTPNVRNNIQTFLDAIEVRENAVSSTLRWYVGSSLGHDSNINSATELGIISTPIGDVELNPSGQSISDSFFDFTGGMDFSKPLSKTTAVNFSANYTKHNNIDSNDFDLDVLAANASYSHQVSGVRLSYGARAQRVNLAGDPFQTSASLITTLQRNPGNGWTQSATAAYTGVRYDTGIAANADLRDINQLLLSGVLGKSSGRFNHTLSVYYGDEQERQQLGRNNAQTFYGVAFAEQYLFRQGHIPYLQVSLHHSENKAAAPIFNVTRADDTFSTSVGWIWTAMRNLNVTTDVTYTNNDSNLPLFSYDRVKYQTGLRYQF